ncbi:energy-coupling factor transport system substrate-specific component [Neobacillus niacini]|uniref:ECF transporter S component n=1 Tax=Neobacillus driksii TaxID=3035913 RepID=UPI0027821611|nr:ECF transporter S component [Neobacillus niacini]MDQ0972361.1 energy-coupling factor transport system substrate-specific component [Neobacillus niacini]
MAHSKPILIGLAILIFVLLVGFPLFNTQHFLAISLLIMAASFFPFMISFSRKQVLSRELVVVAILAAIAAVSRVPFASIPSVQPTTFVIIIAAIVLGPQSGFIIGSLAAIVSNLFLGQGPWTPWQMYAWGMIGLTAGFLGKTWIMQSKIGRCIYGFIVGIAFGWIMNLWVVVGVIQDLSWPVILLYYSSSFYFDLAHAVCNVFFLWVFSSSWMKIIERFKVKYGIFQRFG